MKALLLVTLAVLACSVRGLNPGMKLGLTQNAITYFKDVFMPYIEQQILNANIPMIEADADTPVGTVVFQFTNMTINTVDTGKVNVLFEAPHTIKVTVDDASLTANFAWNYRKKVWPHAGDDGTGNVEAKKISADIGLEVTANKTDGRPIITAPRIRFKIGKIHIKLSGGASWLYNIVITLFKDTIVDTIEKAVINELDSLVDVTLASVMRTIPITIPIDNKFGVDYELTDDPVISTESNLVMSSRAEFYPLELGPGHSSLPPAAALPDHAVSEPKMFEFILSEYTFNTLAFTMTKTGFLNQRLQKSSISDPNATLFFSTDFYSFYAPGMIKKYGNGKQVSYLFGAQSIPSFTITPDGFKFFLPLTMSVEVDPGTIPSVPIWEQAFSLSVDAMASGTLRIEDNMFRGSFALANTTYILRSSDVGEVQVKSLGNLVNFVLTELLKVVNAKFEKGIPIPSIKGLTFIEPVIEWKNKYVAIATSGKYVLPTEIVNLFKHKH